MRSLLFLSILTLILTNMSWGQETTTKTVENEKSSFDKFYERLGIGYFGVYTGSSLDHWDNYSLGEGGTRDFSMAPNIWNQLSFNYNFGAKMNFVVNPRWTTYLQSTSKHEEGTRGMNHIEDALVGFQGVILSSADKKFNLWSRPGIRLPTSQASRAGDITLNVEVLNIYSYDIDKIWQLGLFQQIRHWVYEERFTAYRYRFYNAPYVQYTINDTNRVSLYYEHYLENRKNLESQNGKKPNFKKYWENFMLAWSHDVTPKFNVMPFIGYILNSQHISQYPARPEWLGAWISYQIK